MCIECKIKSKLKSKVMYEYICFVIGKIYKKRAKLIIQNFKEAQF